MKKITILVMLLLLMGCATSSAIVTGQRRAPIHPDMVKLYSQYPAKYEEIALIKGKSEDGWTDDEKIRYAIKAMKKKAASLGANGIVITGQGVEDGSSTVNKIGNSYTVSTSSAQVVSGKAIYVPQ